MPKELSQELFKIYFYDEFQHDEVNFTPVIVGRTKLIFSFSNVYVFVNNKRTVIARKIIFFFFGKYRHFNSLSNVTHPIQIHRGVLEKLRLIKKG